MARLTAEERKTLADLSARDQAESEKDQDLELTVETKSGHRVVLRGAKASAFARKHQLDLDDDDDDAGEEEGLDDEEPAKESIFRGRKKTA